MLDYKVIIKSITTVLHEIFDKIKYIYPNEHFMDEYPDEHPEKGPRREIMYFASSGMLNAIRVDNLKAAFATEKGAINEA